MVFLELAAQAVIGFSPTVRVALKPGYLVFQSPGNTPAPLSSLLIALAFPDGRGTDASLLAPGAKTGRAGVSLRGNDGSVWRLVRDLGGSGALSKLNGATQQFEVVSQDAVEIGQALRAGAGFPPRSTWEQLYTLTSTQLPTKRTRGPVSTPSKVGLTSTKSSVQRLPPAAWNMDAEAPKAAAGPEDAARLAALETELVTAKRAAEVQFRLDGISSELYELESKNKGTDSLAQKVQALRREVDAAVDHSAALPQDIVASVTRYPEECRKYEEQVARIQAEQQAIAEQTEAPPSPLLGDVRFWGGVVGGLGFLVGGMFMEGALRSLALVSLVPFTVAGLMALRFIENLQRAGGEGSKTQFLASREKKLTDEFQAVTAVVKKAYAQVGVSDLDEFLAALGRRGKLVQALADAEMELSQAQAAPEHALLAGQVAKLKAAQEACNQELLSMSGGYLRDPHDIEREIARLKAPASRPSPVPAAPVAAAEGERFALVSTEPKETWDDPMPQLMMLAGDLLVTDIPTVWQSLHDRAVQYLGALTDRRYHDMTVDKDGRATLQAPGRSVSIRELPGEDIDLTYLAMRLALIEKAANQHKLPVVIEDTFQAMLGPAKQPLFGRMVKHLGSLTQVLHVTGAGPNASVTDSPLSI